MFGFEKIKSCIWKSIEEGKICYSKQLHQVQIARLLKNKEKFDCSGNQEAGMCAEADTLLAEIILIC